MDAVQRAAMPAARSRGLPAQPDRAWAGGGSGAVGPARLRPWPLTGGSTAGDTVRRAAAGRRAHARGLSAEQACCDALVKDGWSVLARRLRTAAGEIDIVAERHDGLLGLIEVKCRRTLYEAAHSLSDRQRDRLFRAAEIVLADNPGWGRKGVRFDMLLVDWGGAVRRIADAFRCDYEL